MWFDLEIYNGLWSHSLNYLSYVLQVILYLHLTGLSHDNKDGWLLLPEPSSAHPCSVPGLTLILHSICRKKAYARTFLVEVLRVNLIGLAWVTLVQGPITVTRRKNALIGLIQLMCSLS